MRFVAATSSASDVNGFCTAVTCSPLASSRGITLVQHEPSAHAPCTRTMFLTPAACAAAPDWNADTSRKGAIRNHAVRLMRDLCMSRSPSRVVISSSSPAQGGEARKTGHSCQTGALVRKRSWHGRDASAIALWYRSRDGAISRRPFGPIDHRREESVADRLKSRLAKAAAYTFGLFGDDSRKGSQ